MPVNGHAAVVLAREWVRGNPVVKCGPGKDLRCPIFGVNCESAVGKELRGGCRAAHWRRILGATTSASTTRDDGIVRVF